MEEKQILITEKQLETTIDKAVDTSLNKFKDEIEKNEKAFGSNFIKLEKEDNPAYVGAYTRAVIQSHLTGKSIQETSKALMEKSKTYASEVVYKGVNETTPDEGGYLTVPEIYNQFIELITEKSLMRQLPGVGQATMSAANLTINRETQGAGAYWTGELPTSVTKNDHKYGQYDITPKELWSWSTISKNLINDTAFNVEQQVQNSIITKMANVEDAAFLTGSGASYQPKGIYGWLNASNIIASTGTTAEKYEADFFNAELAIRGQNFMEDLVWVMNWATYSSLRTKLRATSSAIAWPELRDSVPTLLGYKVMFSNTTSNPSSKIFLINPSDFLIVDRAGINIMVNPIQNDSNFPVSINETLIVAHSRVDCVLLHDKSSAVIE